MKITYCTFLRTAKNANLLWHAKKYTQCTGLSYREAVKQCREFNKNRHPSLVKKGTFLEYEREIKWTRAKRVADT